MGLMDVLNGMQNGPRGPRTPSAGGSGGSGSMSPITMAVLGLLAYKAIKHLTGGGASPAPATTGGTLPPSQPAAPAGGGLGGLLSGGLGGLLAGGAAGSVLSGGLNDLLRQFQQSGQGNAIDSWIGNGPNKAISPDELAQVLDSDQIRTLMAHAGLSRDEVLSALSEHLPNLVNEMTPNGRLPSEAEVSRLIQ